MMKRTFKDKLKDFRLNVLRQFVKVWLFFDMKIKYVYHDGFNPKRKEPYILLSNHTFMFDVVHSQLKLTKRIPYTIASRILFVRQPTKYLLGNVGNAIPKSKDASDIKAVKTIFRKLKKGYPIIIFPEGDTTYYGATNHIEESTYKLIKKGKVDLVTLNIKGGYLSRPRWATSKRKNRRAEFHYSIPIKKEELKDYSVEEIKEICIKALYNNDYEYQREKMIPHPGTNLAEGFENATYICPNCNGINSITTKENSITCHNCNTEGYIDEYGFIQGFKFDNLVEWDQYQRTFTKELKQATIESDGKLYFSDFDTGISKPMGNITLRYKSDKLYITGDYEEEIDVLNIKNPFLALRRDLNFTHDNKNYLVKLEKYTASFVRVLQEKY